MSAPDESVTGPHAGVALAQLVGTALAYAHPEPGSGDAAKVRSCPTTTVSDGGLLEAPRGCASSGAVLAWSNRALPQQAV